MSLNLKFKIVSSVLLFLLILLVSSASFDSEGRGLILWRRLFPPKDLFDFVIKEEIDVVSTGVVSIATFEIKYGGPYAVGVLLEKYSANTLFLKDDFKLRIEYHIYSDETLCFSGKTTGDYTSFLGMRGNGLWLAEFEVPEEVPLKKSLTCKVRIVAPDEYLNKKYGPVFFYVQKKSDK
jgi:hypothetical protein